VSVPDPAAAPREGHVERAVRGVRWIGSARLLTQLVTFALTALTVRLLEPRDYGLVATSGLFTVFAETLLDGGLVVVLLSRRELPAQLQGAAASAVLLSGVLLSAAVIAVAPLAGIFFHNPALVPLMWLASLQLPLNASTMLPTVRLLKEMRFRELALAQTLGSIVQGLATLAFAYRGQAYWSLILGTLAGVGVRSLALWVAVGGRPVPNLRFGLLLPLWTHGAQLVAQRMVWFAIGNLDIFLLGRLGGAQVLGAYTLAKNLAHSPLDQLSGVVTPVSMSTFAAKVGDSEGQLRGLVLLVAVTSCVVFPFFWVGGVLSQLAFPLIFGSRWSSLIAPFIAFAAVVPARCIYALVDAAIMGTGRFTTTLKNALTWAAIIAPLLLIGARYGALAEALAWTVGFPFVLGIALWRIATVMGVGIATLIRPMTRPAVCAALSAALAEALILVLAGTMQPALQLALAAVAAGACYLLLLRAMAAAQFADAVRLLARLVRR
jgi:teichuronic acid exporter